MAFAYYRYIRWAITARRAGTHTGLIPVPQAIAEPPHGH